MLLVAVGAYICGSFPTAFLMLKLTAHKDIRQFGSGNVGTLNALRISKSKSTAIIVLLIDLLKGAIPVWLLRQYFPTQPFLEVLTVSFLVIGHSFPVWLRFKGGRGLAVAAGALLVVQPLLVAIWIVIWAVFFMSIRKHIVASMIATFILPIVVFFLDPYYFDNHILLVILIISLLIFERHLGRIPDIVEQKHQSILKGTDHGS